MVSKNKTVSKSRSNEKSSSSYPSSVFLKGFENMYTALNKHVVSINSSKLFAGLMIIVLNISTKYVNLNLPKTVESYLKYSFSKQIMVFAIAWMGTRDIYIALIITVVFIICIDFLFNEQSSMCILPETFITDYMSKLEDVTDDEVKKAKDVLEKAAKKLLETAETDKNNDKYSDQINNRNNRNNSNIKDTSPFY